MDVEARKFCGLLMFNKPFVSSKGPGSFDSSSNYNNNNNNNNLSSSIIQSNYNINSSANPTTNNNRSNDYISLDNSNYNNIIKNNNNNSDDDKSSKDQDEKRPPRPPNAFILYRRARQPAILAAKRHLTNAEISRYISDLWKNESNETKLEWERYADQKKLEHMQAYPNYNFRIKESAWSHL
ncbi:10695_t:CDS:2 [Entrophospora sp. SA101]|nr:10695_t:CDS:2 [Entrophospora sp. SA101]